MPGSCAGAETGTWVVGVLFLAAVIVGLVLLARALVGGRVNGPDSLRPSRDALRILEERYARGEIGEREFKERRSILEEGSA